MNFFKNIFSKTAPQSYAPTRWEELGIIKDEFEIPYLHPFHHNYPTWKGGERWLKLLNTNWGTDIVFTQGLAASNEEKSYELYLETIDAIEHFSSSW